MGKIIELSHDDVQNELAYALICETMEGAYWNSGRRRRMFSKAFTRSEQQRISNIKAKAHKWYLVTGVPEKVRMSYDNYLLWQRLATSVQLSEYQQCNTMGFPFGKAHFYLHVCANRIEWKCTIDNIPLSSIFHRTIHNL